MWKTFSFHSMFTISTSTFISISNQHHCFLFFLIITAVSTLPYLSYPHTFHHQQDHHHHHHHHHHQSVHRHYHQESCSYIQVADSPSSYLDEQFITSILTHGLPMPRMMTYLDLDITTNQDLLTSFKIIQFPCRATYGGEGVNLYKEHGADIWGWHGEYLLILRNSYCSFSLLLFTFTFYIPWWLTFSLVLSIIPWIATFASIGATPDFPSRCPNIRYRSN